MHLVEAHTEMNVHMVTSQSTCLTADNCPIHIVIIFNFLRVWGESRWIKCIHMWP